MASARTAGDDGVASASTAEERDAFVCEAECAMLTGVEATGTEG